VTNISLRSTKPESGSWSGRGIIATLFIFALVALCVRLGFWQLDRLDQRRTRNAQIEARLRAAPVELSRTPTDSTGWLNRRVIVHGTPDEARSIILPGRAYQGSPGAHVLTPVKLHTGQVVLVDRGWVPAADGATVDLARLPRVTELDDTALVLAFPGQERYLGTRDAAASTRATHDSAFRRVWFALDEAALRAQFPYSLGAVHVRLLPATSSGQLPVREPPPELTQGPHLGYAIQWFSFAVIGVIGWVIVVVRARHER
jgi:surfeit locus 1 family protein